MKMKKKNNGLMTSIVVGLLLLLVGSLLLLAGTMFWFGGEPFNGPHDCMRASHIKDPNAKLGCFDKGPCNPGKCDCSKECKCAIEHRDNKTERTISLKGGIGGEWAYKNTTKVKVKIVAYVDGKEEYTDELNPGQQMTYNSNSDSDVRIVVEPVKK